MNLHSNNEDEALKCKSHQNGSRVEKSKFQTYRCISQSKNSSNGTWTFSASRSFVEGIVSEVLVSEISTSKHPKLKSAS